MPQTSWNDWVQANQNTVFSSWSDWVQAVTTAGVTFSSWSDWVQAVTTAGFTFSSWSDWVQAAIESGFQFGDWSDWVRFRITAEDNNRNWFVSSAEVAIGTDQPQKIRIISYRDPEKVMVKELKQYFQEVGYSQQFPNFRNLRISSVHPFVNLIAAEDFGNKTATVSNMFPAITVADYGDNEIALTLGRDEYTFSLTPEYYALILSGVSRGENHISDENRARIHNALAQGLRPTTTVYTFREEHTINWNIWSDNREMTKFLYDAVKQFLITERVRFAREEHFDMEEEVSGHRTGDVNFDFGQVLYGANLSVKMKIQFSALEVLLPYGPYPDNVISAPNFTSTGE